LLAATAVTAAIVIVARFVWIYPATYLPRWLIPSLRKRDPSPPWQQVFVLGFTGVRGVVSLAAALAIPLTIESGAPFPHRDMILFATFGVIIITLIGQGLTLPTVIRWLGIGHHGKAEHRREQEAELAARNEAAKHSRQHLKKLAKERHLSARTVAFLDARHEHRERLIPSDLDDGLEAIHSSNNVRLELIAAERDFLYEMLRDGKITDESRRRLERDLDLEEAAILARRETDTPL
jgi:monovalent cation/hydrogen antiporter